MKLKKVQGFKHDYKCEITEELDKLAGITETEEYQKWGYSHYIYLTRMDIEDNELAIRIPGGTLGSIKYDDNFNVTSVHVSTDYVVDTYPADVNEQLKKFEGTGIENLSDLIKSL